MAELGLNVFQVIQNELIQREGTRSTVGLGSRLTVLEHRLKNSEAFAMNAAVWKLHHAIRPITCVTPETRLLIEKERERLLNRKGADKHKDDKDPTMLPRHQEQWVVHKYYPRTVFDFKQLQFHPERIRSLLEFYEVRVYRLDLRPLNIDPSNRGRDVEANIETCLEELAITWGLNYFKIGGLSLPPPNGYPPPPHNAPTPPAAYTPPPV